MFRRGLVKASDCFKCPGQSICSITKPYVTVSSADVKASAMKVKASTGKVRVTTGEVKASTMVTDNDIVPAWVATWAKYPNNAKSRSLL